MSAIIGHASLLAIEGGGLDPIAQEIIDNFNVTPDLDRQTLINEFVIALRLSGVWDKLDVLNVFAASDSQSSKLCWKNVPGREFTQAVPGGTVTQIVDVGYQGGSSGSLSNRIEINFDPALDGINYNPAGDDFSAGIYLYANPTTTKDELFGTVDTLTLSQIRARYDVAQNKIQAFGSGNVPGTSPLNSSELGLLVVQRSSSSSFDVYNKNGLIKSTIATGGAFTSGNTGPYYVFGCSGTSTQTSDATISMFFLGASLTAGEIQDLSDAMEAFIAGL